MCVLSMKSTFQRNETQFSIKSIISWRSIIFCFTVYQFIIVIHHVILSSTPIVMFTSYFIPSHSSNMFLIFNKAILCSHIHPVKYPIYIYKKKKNGKRMRQKIEKEKYCEKAFVAYKLLLLLLLALYFPSESITYYYELWCNRKGCYSM